MVHNGDRVLEYDDVPIARCQFNRCIEFVVRDLEEAIQWSIDTFQVEALCYLVNSAKSCTSILQENW